MNNTHINKDFNVSNKQVLDWETIQTQMKNKLGSDVYESWLKKINFEEEINNYVLLSVPTRFIRDWITSRYLDQILQILKIHKREISRIEFKIIEKKQEENNFNGSESGQDLHNENVSFILVSLILLSFKLVS